MTTIGQRVIAVREEKGWNQAKLVRESKLPQSTVASIENDSRTKESSALIDVAHTLCVDAYWLKTGKGNRLGGRQLSEDEEALLNALPLIDQDVRESWIELAKKKLGRHEAGKQKAA